MLYSVFRECITKVAHNIIIIHLPTCVSVRVYRIQFAHLTRYMQRYYIYIYIYLNEPGDVIIWICRAERRRGAECQTLKYNRRVFNGLSLVFADLYSIR